MTAQLSREQLLEIVETDHVQCGEAAAMSRMLLAGMDSEPGEYITHVVDDGVGEFSDRMNFSLPVGTKLYAAPPAPVAVPDNWPDKLTWSYHDDMTQAEVLAWNNAIDACRAAMINHQPAPVHMFELAENKKPVYRKLTWAERITGKAWGL